MKRNPSGRGDVFDTSKFYAPHVCMKSHFFTRHPYLLTHHYPLNMRRGGPSGSAAAALLDNLNRWLERQIKADRRHILSQFVHKLAKLPG